MLNVLKQRDVTVGGNVERSPRAPPRRSAPLEVNFSRSTPPRVSVATIPSSWHALPAMRPAIAFVAGSLRVRVSGAPPLARVTRSWSRPTSSTLRSRSTHDDLSPTAQNPYSHEDIDIIIRGRKAGTSVVREITSQINGSQGSVSKTYSYALRTNGSLAGSIRPRRPFSATKIDDNKTWIEIARLLEGPATGLSSSYRLHASEKDFAHHGYSSAAWPSAVVKQLYHMRDDFMLSWRSMAPVLKKTVPSTMVLHKRGKVDEPRGPRRWTREEDQLLTTLRKEQLQPWKHVSQALPRRSPHACFGRFSRIKPVRVIQVRSFTTAVPRSWRSGGSSIHAAVPHATGLLVRGIPRFFPGHGEINCKRCLIHTEAHVPKQPKRFTKEENTIILQRRCEKVSFRDIATELGRDSDACVRMHFYRLVERGEPGDVRRNAPLLIADFDDMAQKRAAGILWRDIAPLYHRTSSSCRDLYNKHIKAQLQPHLQNLPRRRWKDAEVSHLLDCRNRLGQPWHEIAGSLERSAKSVASKYAEVKLRGQKYLPTHMYTYSSEEDEGMLYLRDFLGLSWKQIHSRITHRSITSLRNRYRCYNGPEHMHFPDRGVVRFSPADYAVLHDLRCKQQLSWETVREKMPKWTIKDLQDRHALLIKWPPSTLSSPLTSKLKQSRMFTTVTESSLSLFGSSRRTPLQPRRHGTFWTRPTRWGEQSRYYRASQSPSIRRRGKKYDDAAILRMVEKRKEGKSYAAIAMDLGFQSVSGVSAAIRRWATKNSEHLLIRPIRQRASGYDHQRIKEMKSSGMIWHETTAQVKRNAGHLARQYYHTEETLALSSDSCNLFMHRNGFIEDDVRFLVHARDSLRRSCPEIGHRMGRTPNGVSLKYYQQRENSSIDRPSSFSKAFSQVELDTLDYLRSIQKLPWDEIQRLMSQRSKGSLKVKYHRLVRGTKAALELPENSFEK